MDGQRPPEERFDEALRVWADRPPRLDAAAAAEAVVGRVGARRRHPPRRAWALAAATAAVVAAAAVVVVRLASPPTAVGQVGMVLAAPALSEGQVLLWLDEETPLYMTYAAPEVRAQ